jgi:hypothetical protein
MIALAIISGANPIPWTAIEDRRVKRDRKIVTQGPRAERGQATPRTGTFARAGQSGSDDNLL